MCACVKDQIEWECDLICVEQLEYNVAHVCVILINENGTYIALIKCFMMMHKCGISLEIWHQILFLSYLIDSHRLMVE